MIYVLYVLAFIAVIEGCFIKLLFDRVEFLKGASKRGAIAGIKLSTVLLAHDAKIGALADQLLILSDAIDKQKAEKKA